MSRLLHLIIAVCLCCVMGTVVYAEEESAFQTVEIADPYIEMHTGPGEVYPIFHVVDRGDTIEILKRKNEWFKVRTRRGKEGWVSRKQLEKTLNPDGSQVQLATLTRDDFNQRRWEGGVLGGEFGGAPVISVYGAYSMTKNLAAEISLSHVQGNFSNSLFVSAHIITQPFPEWRYSPFMTLGTGVIRTEPDSTLVASEDRTDDMLHAGIGVRTFLRRNFVLRAEYKAYTVITSRDDNDEVEEWKLGFSVFF